MLALLLILEEFIMLRFESKEAITLFIFVTMLLNQKTH